MKQPNPIHSIVGIESSALTNRKPHQRIRRMKLHVRQQQVEVIPDATRIVIGRESDLSAPRKLRF
jgi:hypothetical protein